MTNTDGVAMRQTGRQVPPDSPAETPGIDDIMATIGKRKTRRAGDVEIAEEPTTTARGGSPKKKAAKRAPRRKAAKKATKRKATTKKKAAAKKRAPAKPPAKPATEEAPPQGEVEQAAHVDDGGGERDADITAWTCPDTRIDYPLHEGQAVLDDGTPVMIVKEGFTLLFPDGQPRLKSGGLIPADDPLLQWDLHNGKPWSERHKLAPASPEDFEANGNRVHPVRSPGAAGIFREFGYTKVTYLPTGAAAMEERRAKVKAGRAAQRAASRAHRTARPAGGLDGDDAKVPSEV